MALGELAWAHVAAVALFSVLSACGGTARSPSSNATRADGLDPVLYEASHPCPELEPVTTTARGGASELLVEAVLLDVPLNQATQARTLTLKQLLARPDLRLLGSPHFSGNFDATTRLNLEQHFGALEQLTLSRVSLVPRHSDTDRIVIELELGFSLPNANPATNPQTASASLLVEAPYRSPSLGFAKHPDDPKRQLIAIVTVYPFRSPSDLRALFECKMRLRQHEIEQR